MTNTPQASMADIIQRLPAGRVRTAFADGPVLVQRMWTRASVEALIRNADSVGPACDLGLMLGLHLAVREGGDMILVEVI